MRNSSRSPGAFCAGISMREVALFGEDRAHQLVVGALLRRLAEEHRVEVSLVWRQAYGGHGRMKHELNDYLRALRQQREPLPDLIVAATDAKLQGAECAHPRDCGLRPTNTAGSSRHSGPAHRALAAARRRRVQGRVRSRLPSPGPEMRSRSLQAASGGDDSGCRDNTRPRRHRVFGGHHATHGHRPRSTCGRFVPAFHRQLAHRASTLAAVNGSRARGAARGIPARTRAAQRGDGTQRKPRTALAAGAAGPPGRRFRHTQTIPDTQPTCCPSIAFAPALSEFFSAVSGEIPSQINRSVNDDPFGNALCSRTTPNHHDHRIYSYASDRGLTPRKFTIRPSLFGW